MSEKVTVVYDGIAIEYSERSNDWTFELRGRERKVESLAKAKEAINKTPKEKNKFERIPALKKSYGFEDGNGFRRVEITSIADMGYGGRRNVWISGQERREKVSLSDLYAITPENEQLAAEIKALQDQKDLLVKQADTKQRQMTNPELPTEEGE